MGLNKNLPKDYTGLKVNCMYHLTKAELEQLMTDELVRRVREERWVREEDMVAAIDEISKISLNAGFKIVFIALMEQHLMGSSRIERDLVDAVRKLDKEFSRCIVENSPYDDVALDMLEARYINAVNSTKKTLR